MNSKTSLTPKVRVNKAKDQLARAVQTQLRKMIELELSSKPVSDYIHCKMLADKGMAIARRKVLKHRELMNIPPVAQRK